MEQFLWENKNLLAEVLARGGAGCAEKRATNAGDDGEAVAASGGAVRVHAVLGNEACDLDSTVCALVYAHFLAKTRPAGTHVVHMPVLNISREDLPLRPDVCRLLGSLGLSPAALTFRDEASLHTLHARQKLTLTLVDHNLLPHMDTELEPAVVEVIDHHRLERPPSPGCCVTVEPVGSCASLVGAAMLLQAPHLLDLTCATMLAAAIVVDCVDMRVEAGRVTTRDREVLAELRRRFPLLPPSHDTFITLHAAKFDVSGLTVEQTLRKDMKVLKSGDISVAVCALFTPLEEYLGRPQLEEDLRAFCQARGPADGYAALVLMAVSFPEGSPVPSRQVAVYSCCGALQAQICGALQAADSPDLQLRAMESRCPVVSSFQQGTHSATRKHVLPILAGFLQRTRDRIKGGQGHQGGPRGWGSGLPEGSGRKAWPGVVPEWF
ncbi:exopolyphosphatase PRUNE1 isoform X2 [Lethenteron reissneri]|uniref:exopolyphosphatase PRUNE1 isoform X2 n=1 Tax=Lethenteron reissneri TaxID=7753 RepID=UPI002AB71FD5|nr:exopolyphosphatase PRUNE1 isoform X2 [Lethenteron reissneri]